MFLLDQSSLRKGVGKKAAISAVICVVSTKYGVNPILSWRHPEGVLREIRGPLVMTIDVVPSSSIDEGELVRSQADDWSITFV